MTKAQTSLNTLLVLALLVPFGVPGYCGDSQRKAADVGSLPSEASQFDFWIGTWKVGANGVDKVKRFGKGVAITEKYTAGAYSGSSINVFDTVSATWTQTWLDGVGHYFQVTGKKEGNDIVLVGDFKDPHDGKVKRLRLSFVDIKRDSFKQKYETSEDNGTTWTILNTVPFERTR